MSTTPTVTVPRSARLAAYILSSIGGLCVTILGMLSLLLGYSSAIWFLAITIIWPVIHSYVTALAAGYVPESTGSVPTGVDASTVQVQVQTAAGNTVTATATDPASEATADAPLEPTSAAPAADGPATPESDETPADPDVVDPTPGA